MGGEEQDFWGSADCHRITSRRCGAIEDRYDVVVVGCGPAGASAAAASARRGLSALLIDRKRSVGVPARSAGYVPLALRRRVWFDDACVLQPVAGFRLFLPDGRTAEVAAPGYILDRTRFDKTLTLHAVECGADLANGTVVGVSGPCVRFRRGGQEAEVEGRVIIGADGPRSAVRRAIGAPDAAFMVTAQAEVGLRVPFDAAEVRFDRRCAGGYMWFFPSGRTARVGVGVPAAHAPLLRRLLGDFLEYLADEGRVYAEAVLGYSGGPSPAGGLLPCVQRGHALLAGDAAGCTDPFTGSGIYGAVLSGDLAGRTAARALLAGDDLAGYRRALERVLSSLYRVNHFKEVLS